MPITSACRIQADAIIVSSQQLYAPGQIVIRHGRIVEVTASLDAAADVSLENCVLLPGLINPHTHLEFSDLAQPLPPGKDFPEWIQNVLAIRQRSSASTATLDASVAIGLNESRSAGVVAVGDIVTPPWLPNCLTHPSLPATAPSSQEHEFPELKAIKPRLASSNSWPQVIAFIEQLGLSNERRQALAAWREPLLTMARDSWPARLAGVAISPHAPYSTPPALWQELALIAQRSNMLLAMHVLESPAEREWLDNGTGPMAAMLAHFGAADWRLPSDFMAQLCQHFSRAKSALLIHGNYLTDAELDLVAQAKNISMVYCPRTHAHFGHMPYPLAAIEQRGIRLLLGTDSRSTNPDLNLWQEARTACRLHATLRPSQAFAAITDSAAQALGLQHDYGSLQPGRMAAINCIRLPQITHRTLDELLAHLFEQVAHPTLLAR